MLLSGYIVIATDSGLVSFFNPETRTIVHSAQMPVGAAQPIPKPNQLQQMAADALLVGMSDGSLLKLPLTEVSLLPVDLGSLRVTVDEDDSAAGFGRVRITTVEANFVMRVEGEQASSTAERPLKFDYSTAHQLLALVNSAGKLMIRRSSEPDASTNEETILGAQMPEGACIGCDWEPGLESQLSVAVRNAGAALWRVGSNDGVQMWSGMRYRNSLNKFTSSHREFDPLVQSWSAAGQLVVGMSDGSFAVWDSLTSQTFASQRSGRHKHGIKAASWLPSLFAPALALGSLSNIKVSQGFDSVEWSATAMKLKIKGARKKSGRLSADHAKELLKAGAGSAADLLKAGKEKVKELRSPGSTPNLPARRSFGGGEEEGDDDLGVDLDFVKLEFSPSGKLLAAIAASPPTFGQAGTGEKQVKVYEIQDQCSALVPLRTVGSSAEDGTPFGIAWQPDDSLLVFLHTRTGGSVISCSPRRRRQSDACYPPPGVESPGPMVDAAATSRGLLAMAFAPRGGAGLVQIISTSPLALLLQLPLESVPMAIKLKGVPGNEHFLTVGFEAGGVEVWALTPEQE